MAKDVQTIKYNQKSDDPEAELDRKWWTKPAEKAYESIWPLVAFIRQSQAIRHQSNVRYFKFYANQQLDNLAATRYLNNLSSFYGESARVSYNVIKSCIDTARSKIAKQKPRPMFLTENGDWNLQQRAKRLNQFIMGLFDQIGSPNGLVRESLYTIGSNVFFDACVTGTGAAKMYIYNNKIVAEQCLSDEIIVDQFEGMYRAPRSMHQVKYIDRDVLYDLYPKHKDQIRDAKKALTGEQNDSQDMIPVIESYHLPSGPMAKDGRKVICIETGTLASTSWDKQYFPFLIQRWSMRPVGFYGIGLAEELQGIQREMNQTLLNIQTALRRVAVPRVWRHINDHNPNKRLTNEIGEIGYFSDAPPIFQTPNAMTPEVYNHVDRLYQKAFETTGISQLSSTSAKPAGLDSGVALRNYQDIESERFASVHKMYENFYTPQATYMALDLLETLLAAGEDTIVQAHDGMTFKPVKYSEVRIPLDSFTVRAYPTAYLPTEPAGKFQKVKEGVEAGFWDKDEAMDLLDFPDISKAMRVKQASRNACYHYVEHLVDTGEYLPVEPYQDIQLTKELLQSYYLEGRTQGMPQDRLDLLQQVMDEIRVREDEAAQAAAEAAMEAQAAMAPPEPTQMPPGAQPPLEGPMPRSPVPQEELPVPELMPPPPGGVQ